MFEFILYIILNFHISEKLNSSYWTTHLKSSKPLYKLEL